MQKFYHAIRGKDACEVTVEYGMNITPLNPRNDLRNHSPAGFNWGYGGSGPAQLALALCADALGDDQRALRVYQAYKWRVLGREQRTAWTLTRLEVMAIIMILEEEKAHSRQAVRGKPGSESPDETARETRPSEYPDDDAPCTYIV